LYRLEIILNVARSVHRGVVAVPFLSNHYPHLDRISLCDVYELPTDISCQPTNITSWVKSNKCEVFGDDWRRPEEFNRSKSTSGNFDWTSTLCVAGAPVPPFPGRYPRITHWQRLVVPDQQLRPHFHGLFRLVDAGLPRERNTTNLVMVHWRRYDQHYRCQGLVEAVPDRSVNCQGPHELDAAVLSDARAQLPPPLHPHKATIFYVATNERNATILAQLRTLGYLTFRNTPLHATANALEQFIVEYLMFCHADAVLMYGPSGVHKAVRDCRTADATKLRLTLLDGKPVASPATPSTSKTDAGKWLNTKGSDKPPSAKPHVDVAAKGGGKRPVKAPTKAGAAPKAKEANARAKPKRPPTHTAPGGPHS